MYTETIGSTARAAKVAVATVRAYADKGLVECIRTADGRRMFQASAAQRVREIYRERMARRGRARS